MAAPVAMIAVCWKRERRRKPPPIQVMLTCGFARNARPTPILIELLSAGVQKKTWQIKPKHLQKTCFRCCEDELELQLEGQEGQGQVLGWLRPQEL